jgi:hypothetical protein
MIAMLKVTMTKKKATARKVKKKRIRKAFRKRGAGI